MKTRNDFVSNSSSCSFIVNDINAFKDKLSVLSPTKDGKYIDTSWMYGLKVRFKYKDTEENRKIFKNFDSTTYNSYAYYDEWVYVSDDFEKLLNIDPQYYNLLQDVEVYTYNDHDYQYIQSLALLYLAMKNEGVDVDNSNSEQDFGLFVNFPTQLIKAAMKPL